MNCITNHKGPLYVISPSPFIFRIKVNCNPSSVTDRQGNRYDWFDSRIYKWMEPQNVGHITETEAYIPLNISMLFW